MLRSYRRHAVALVALVALALLAPSAPTFGQPGQPVDQRIDVPEYADVPAGAASIAQPEAVGVGVAASPNAAVRVLLPVVQQPAAVAPVQFASQYNKDTGALINPATVFNYGVTNIYAASTVVGGKGQSYLMRWSFDGVPNTSLDRTGTLYSDSQYIFAGFCYGVFGCGSAIPRRTMVLQVFLNNTLVQQGQAVIR